MLFSIIFELTTDRPARLPPFLGRANHAQFLAWIGQIDPALARDLHEADQLRPITCSSLQHARLDGDMLRVRAGETYAVRITSLHPDLSARLDQWLRIRPPTEWPLHNHAFAVTAIYCDADRHAWSGLTTYEETASVHLLGRTQPERKLAFELASPTAFKSQGMHLPVPLPGLLFGSLLDRWNAFSPVELPVDLRAYAETAVAVSYYRLQTERVSYKRQSVLIGATGRITYTALDTDRYWLAALNVLADFALYCGVGIKTTVGLGQVRRSI
ncbi:MAG: CRISPR system precrRNA processing endoribonuclease RAMP protein Cas6 [Caldilineaceae bacterium]|nr:CRISPR system precrRNA processing endoribonuclease RAMP protein Cas6 [Caldilineaceae bacterium]